MGSDRARNTYDETKQYRRVVPQQGRVILEADLNEASAILTEDARHEMLDVIGPAGVPSDPLTDVDGTGYAISTPVAATHEFSIGPGVIYVGGWRVVQPDPELRYSNQPDWLDGPIPMPMPPNPGFDLALLRLREQEVSAVEDPTLREVALGGPDTAQRVRLIRRVERFAVTKAACSAWSDVVAAWTKLGLVFDPNDMSLAPTARLAVGPEKLGPDPGPCDPAANDGFLGAENQMIRVQIASATELLWGYDDASALYRVELDPDDSSNQTLKFHQAPVDAFHQPHQDQYVEVLRAAASLGDDAYAAAATGVVTTLKSAYQPDVAKVVLSVPLTGAYTDPKQTPALFLRVWQNLSAFTAGTPQPLVDQAGNHIGLQVTLTSGPFIAGNFWFFAVRPTMPNALYPARYANPQPPEGPREWVCPLAVIDWTQKPTPTTTDCRPTFDNLVTLTSEVDKLTELERNTGCCTVTVSPEDLTEKQTLQTIVDQYKSALKIGARVTICLKPGVYALREPLRLGEDHSGLAIEGCHGGAVIEAAKGFEGKFLDGLFVLVHADEVTLRGLRFHLPQVPFAKSGGLVAALPLDRIGSEATELEQLSASIAIRPVHAAELTIEDCLFRYSLAKGQHVFGVGIFAGSECWGLRIVDNKFVMDEDYLRHEADLTRLLYGYIIAPTAAVTLGPPPPGRPHPGLPPPKLSDAVTGGTVAWALLTDAEVHGNLFSGLIASALILADCGTIRIEDNRVRESYGGFWITSFSSIAPHKKDSGDTHSADAAGAPDLEAFQKDPLFFTSIVLAIAYPAPPGLLPGDIQQVKIDRTKPGSDPHRIKPPVPEPVEKPPVGMKWPVIAKKQPATAKQQPAAAKQPEVAKPDTATPPNAAREPGAAEDQPDATAKLLPIESDELGLAMRFAAATGGRALTLSDAVGDAIGLVLATGFGELTQQPRTMAVRVVDNDIDARIEGFVSGSALVVADAGTDPRAAVMVSANRIANASIALPTALISGPRRIAITGNLMENDTLDMTPDVQLRRLLAQLQVLGRKLVTDTDQKRVIDLVFERWCLVAEPSSASANLPLLVAITGNVFEGLNDLPDRLGSAMPPWDTLNTMSLGGP